MTFLSRFRIRSVIINRRILLLSPPEIHPLPAPAGRPPSPFSSFIDAMNFNNNNNNRVLEPKPLMWPKGNLSPTFQSSGNPCLDFFNMEQYTPRETVRELLRRAWAHNPLTTLKLILRRRVNSHGLLALVVLWLHQNHPKTLAWNVRWFAEVGYMKYLLDILFAKAKTARWESTTPFKQGEIISNRKTNKDQANLMNQSALTLHNSDSSYRLLYDNISDFLSESLKSDIGFLNSGEFNKIGLAAKWCLSLDSSLDRSTLLCETIAKKVFPRESDPSYSGIEESHYTYRVCDRLREEILAPLDKFHDLPVELRNLHMLYIYQLVSSVVRKTYKNLLEKQEPGRFSECFAELNEGYYKYLSERHEPKRFFELLDKVDKWEAKNSAEALLPHEILSYNNINEVKELQWKRMVEDLSNKGKLTNCLSVCDVSGSMDVSGRNDLPSSTIIDGKVGDFSRSMAATRMKVCVALGLLTSELSEKPWRGNVINFSPNPKLHTILGERLQEKVKFIKRMECGMTIDFQKLFDRILDVAVASKLEEEKMVKRVFVFSDMGFAEASGNSWETDYHAIHRKYEEKGYGSSVPEIVFWNLCDLTSLDMRPPLAGREKGVVLVTGFSKNLLNIFLQNGGVVNPEEVIEEAIAREEYQRVEYITMSPPVDPLPSPTTSQNHLPFPAGKLPSPFRDAMNALFNNLMGVPKSPTGLTENISPTFLSSGNPCMDFFFYVMPGTRTEMVTELLRRAWVHDPLTTLKLICQLRKVGEAGKSDKEGFYTAVCWLHQNHP
ncbi:plant/T31B5-30 protein [Cinnamomum micranthum f. kanehirae]|uniref:Plant/T31B5-30 protein n=1 Tax=Cinnamomum micranthum f. kanehirae TaxID=337451 RepID=A0A3S3Q3U2_9MAGN|nr:plant/T31B5-30 protein [Cinnamomum micranthum f. kanehirae]